MAHAQPQILRVVVADDNAEFRRIIVSILQPTFSVVQVVACGSALIDAVLKLAPDVIVSDVSMPTSGIEAMQRLRESGCTAPFVLVTAGCADPLEWMNLGALGIVDKVDLLDELQAAVKSAAEGFSYLSAKARRSCS